MEEKGPTGDNKENGPFKQDSVKFHVKDCTSTRTRKRVKFNFAYSIAAPDKSYTELYERRSSFRNWPININIRI